MSSHGSQTTVSFDEVSRTLNIPMQTLFAMRKRGVMKDVRRDSTSGLLRMSALDRLRVMSEMGDLEARRTVEETESRIERRNVS